MPKHHPRGRVRARVVNPEVLRARLDALNMTVLQLVGPLGCSTSWGYKITNGDTDTCSLRLAEKIEAALDCRGQAFAPILNTQSVSQTEPDEATAGAA